MIPESIEIKIGDVFWAIEASQETYTYDAEAGPVMPWPGKITKDNNHTWGGSYCLSYWHEGMKEPDLDTNATAYCDRKQLFLSREDANIAYKEAVERKIKSLVYEIEELKNSLLKL